MTTCYTLLSCLFGESVTITAIQLPASKMEGPTSITCKGFARCSSCTVQCWTLQTFYFLCTAYYSVSATVNGIDSVQASLTTRSLLWVMYEVSFTWALVVTCIVTFVLIPGQLSRGMNLALMFNWKARMMHNVNLLFMVTELVFNDLRFVWSHVTFAILFGMYYAVFSWGWLRFAGVVYYPFIDPSCPWRKSIFVHLALLGGIAGIFFVGVGAGELLSRIPFLFSVVLAYAASFCVMWTGFNGIPEQPQVSTTPTRDLGAAPQEGVRHSCDRSPGNRGGYRGTGHQLRTRC